MIETVVALLMFVNGEIKSKKHWKRQPESVSYKCYNGKQNRAIKKNILKLRIRKKPNKQSI